MRPHSIIRTLAATALIALPSLAMAAPDQNTNNNGCPSGQWRNGSGQCVNNGNNGNNGQWNNGRQRQRDQDDNNRANRRDRDDRNRRDNDDRNNRNNGQYNNGGYNNGGYNNGGYNNGGYNNGGYNNGGYNNGGYNNGGYNNGRGNQLSGSVRSFSPYNLYLSNGTHVMLHNGTVINPTGSNLTAGQSVRVIGNWNQDGTFNASEIDVTGNGYNRYQR